MAGRPRTRAARQAAQLAATSPPPEEIEDGEPLTEEEAAWAAQAAKIMGVPAPQAGVLASTAPRAQVMQEVQREDRVSLAVWWREQIQALEDEHDARTQALAQAGDHPSPAYASQVRKFGALGMPTNIVATLLGIPEGLMMQHYERDYSVGEGLLIAPVAANLFRIATSGNDRVAVKAAIEIMNRRGGEPWKPPAQKLEIDDSRSKKQRVIDSSKLSWEQRQQLRAIVMEHTGDVVPTGSGLIPSPVIEDTEPDE